MPARAVCDSPGAKSRLAGWCADDPCVFSAACAIARRMSALVLDGLWGILRTALGAREQVVNSVKSVLKMANVPSLEDVQKLETKLDEIEAIFEQMRDALEKKKPSA
jgi:hypothetical protein